MKKYKIRILLAFLLGLALTGCEDKFLDIQPYARADENAFYTSLSAADALTVGAYAQPLNSMDIMDTRYMMVMGSIASDDAELGGSGASPMQEGLEIDAMTYNSGNVVCERVWGHIYKGIDRCNVALEKFPLIAKIETTELAQKTLAVRTGEIKFLRGLYYFLLAQVYGGVPLLTQTMLPSYNPERAPLKDVYAQIENDLLSAIELLPEKDANTEGGRATKGAAQALLAKLYLYESSFKKNYGDDAPYNRFDGFKERWDDVVKYGEQVIVSGKYQLMGANGERFSTFWSDTTGGYRYLFTVAADNCDEVIFTVNYVDDKKTWGDSRGNTLNMHSVIGSIIPRKKPKTTIQYGWNFHQPTQDLINEFEQGDPRLKTTAAFPGDTIYAKVEGNFEWSYMDLSQTTTGSVCRKYELGPDYTSDFFRGPQNVNLIRYADLLLMTAEAYIQLGNLTRAAELINMVRTRARNSGSTGKPENISVPSTKEEAMKALVHERRVELAMEGIRFFDLVRWNLAKTELVDAQSKHLMSGFDCQFQSPKNDFYPIPEREIILSKGVLKQNPGW